MENREENTESHAFVDDFYNVITMKQFASKKSCWSVFVGRSEAGT